MLLHTQGPLAQWLEQATHNRLVAGSSPARATKSLFTYQEELRVQGVLDGGLYFMTNAISRKKCGGWFRMRAGVLVRGTPLQCIYPSVLIRNHPPSPPSSRGKKHGTSNPFLLREFLVRRRGKLSLEGFVYTHNGNVQIQTYFL